MDYTCCSNGYEDLRVQLVNVSHDRPLEMFWNWFRTTWYSILNEDFDPKNERHMQAVRDVISRRALPVPMEVISFEVKIDNLSRVALAQITRGRVGHVYVVTSQMPEPIEHGVTIPKNIYEHPIFSERARHLQAMAMKLYDDMHDAGIPPQDCRYMTLHGQQTNLMWHVNYSALLGWYARRCENGLTDELNTVGRLLRRELRHRFLNAIGEDKDQGSGWGLLIDKLDCVGADRNVCMNNDRVFGNTGRFPPAGSWVPDPTNADNTPDYDFSMSAFFLELLQYPDDMLFPGEREMIDDWKSIGFTGRLKKLREDE